MAPHDKKWDDSAERDLCVAIILGNQDNTKGRQNWPRIAEIMDGLGYSFSKDAMSQHYSKTILKDFKARHGSAATGTSDSPPLSARKPRGAGKATTTPSKKRPKKSAQDPPNAKGKLPDMGDDEDDDLDYESTPCKRVKKEEKGVALKKEEGTATKTPSAAIDNEEAFYAWAATGSSTT